MNPPGKTSSKAARRLFLLFFLFVITVFLIRSVPTASIAQSADERELEDTTPTHLPIKVKIKKEKEKAFKDLNNEHWARDLELEVTNTGDKPIYFIDFILEMPEIKPADGNK